MSHFWVLLLGIGIGFALSYWGTRFRMRQIESDLRWIANAAAEHDVMTDGEPLPGQWVTDQVDNLRLKNFP
jgi:hypothetical protein